MTSGILEIVTVVVSFPALGSPGTFVYALISILEERGWVLEDGGIALPTVPSINPKKQIDYVLVRPQKSWRVIDVSVIDEKLASDHCPIFMILELMPGK